MTIDELTDHERRQLRDAENAAEHARAVADDAEKHADACEAAYRRLKAEMLSRAAERRAAGGAA